MSPFPCDLCAKGDATLSLLSLRCHTVLTRVGVTSPRALPLHGHQPAPGRATTVGSHHLILGVTPRAITLSPGL